MNKCDLEEVKHQLCQEALELIKTDAVWKPFRPTPFSYSGYLCGKFFVSYGFGGCYELKVFVGREKDGSSIFESVGSSHNPAYWMKFTEEGNETKEEFDTRFEEKQKKFEASPAYIVYKHVTDQEKKREDQKKCEALTRMLGKDAPRVGQVVEVDEIPDNGIPNRPWWRFW